MMYVKGQVVTVRATFSIDGVATDPTTTTFKVKHPDASIDEFVYGIDSEVIRDSAGAYRMDIDCDASGTFYYRIEAEGAVVDAIEKSFEVKRSQFD